MIDTDILDSFRAILGMRRVVTNADDIAPWLTDWRGRYHGSSAAILEPHTVEEVAAIVRLARERGVPLVPQGGNTSMVGGATPPADGRALILSLRKMNTIRSIDIDANEAVCEAGVILSTLHEAAIGVERRFPLSLGAKGSATIGGLISTNAGGTQVIRHGTMRGLVLGIEAVLPDGSIYDGLASLKKDNRGYDIKQLLIGAEGTLGVITAATLRLAPAITESMTVWVGLSSPTEALTLLRWLQGRLGPVIEGFEVAAGECLANVLAHIPGARSPIASQTPWHALIDIDLSGTGTVGRERAEAALLTFLEWPGAIDATIAQNETQASEFWRLRESISEAERAARVSLPYDISVPVDTMPAFMVEAAEAVKGRFPGASGTAFGHLGDGNVHFHVCVPGDREEASQWVGKHGHEVSRFVNDLVIAAGGSISAEHGIGQMKRAELGRTASPAQLHGLRAIKAALDPDGIMNPEKLIPLASEG